MQSLNNDYDRPSSAFVRRRLAEATLSQDQHDGSAWARLDPGPAAVSSNSPGARSLHEGLLGNALHHIEQYMDQDTYALAIGDSLEAHLDSDGYFCSQPPIPMAMSDDEYMRKLASILTNTDPTPEIDHVANMPPAAQVQRRATITYHGNDDTLKTLPVFDLDLVTKKCPLLGMAFEESRSGPQLFLETLSARTAEPFSRFLNTGSYAAPSEEWNSAGRYEDVPTSVLLHCEMFRLGDIYDLPDMKSQAYVNIFRQCEFGCSSPDKPIDLCAAIRFVYTYLAKEEQLLDAIVNYCVACFIRHRLAEDAEFKQLAYDLRPFHQDLCKNCMNRGYENETAAAIIQMPFEPHRPETYASTEHRRSFQDVIFHFHANDELDSLRKRKRADVEIALPIRSIQDETKALHEVSAPDFHLRFAEHRRRLATAKFRRSAETVVKKEEDFEEIYLEPVPEKNIESDTESFEWVDVLPAHVKNDVASSNATILPGISVKAERAEGGESDSEWSLL